MAHVIKYCGGLLFNNIDNKYAIKHLAHVVNHSAKSPDRHLSQLLCVLKLFSFVAKTLQ